ncbi:TRAP transporter substrate-binding protein [Aminobacter aminovorans]|uniref:TRAP-type C4-dicarboxylate transport system substrate-binding protein n=1 Tax=Aminobacter aminovorans TaxID=83263 RepID=A0AAC8YW52_AMIAI|nr:TRAP transporter substrate-binding protein [Aminobacter aminovorans]AMS45517.1 hypothetical protein AA2016_6627 [Aminobacter aminovorans]MBB3708592.1 TRAP-type C4-dicarboxylate transport system substrate-binding protein [Aminobacter aminovorans]
MNIRAIVSRAAAGLVGASMLSMLSVASYAQEVTIRFGSFVGPTSFLNTGILEPWFKQVEADAGGKLKVEFLPGGSAAKPTEILDAVKVGIVEAGWSMTAYNPGRFKAAGVTELPGLMNGPIQGAAGMSALYDAGLLDGFDGVKIIGFATADVARLHHRQDVSGLADFKGAKIRTAGAVLSDMMTRIGATPIGMPTGVVEALATGVLDGAAADWFSLEGFRYIEVTKTHVDLALGAPAMYMIMNQRTFDGLPEEVKASFEKNNAAAFSKFWSERLEAESKRVRAVVAGMNDHKILEPTGAEKEMWDKAAEEAIAAWVTATPNGQAVLDTFKRGIQAK